MIRLSFATLAVIWSLSAAATAQEAVRVEKILPGPGGKLIAFNEKGVSQGDIPADSLPPVPFTASAYNPKTKFVRVTAGGKEVWLSPMQAQTSVKAQVLNPCETVDRVKGTPYSSRGASDCK